MATPARRLVGIAIIPLLGAALIVGSRVLTEQQRGEPERLRAEGPAEVLADLRRIGALGVFAGRGDRADAAPELNLLFASDGQTEGAGRAPWAARDHFAALEPYKADGAWAQHPELAAGFDVSFLAAWERYDHWAWDSSEPYRGHFSDGDPCPLTVSIPNYISATWIARVRLMQGLAAGDLGPAMREVEHLAMLVASTDTLVGSMVAVAILQHEQTALEAAQARGVVAPAVHWTRADLDRLKAALAAVPLVLDEESDPGVRSAFAAEAPSLPGACGALADAAATRSITRTAVWSPWPGEVDQGGRARAVDAALAGSGCALPYVRSVWASDEVRASCLGNGGLIEAPMALDLPYLRGPVVATLDGLAAWGQPGPYGVQVEGGSR